MVVVMMTTMMNRMVGLTVWNVVEQVFAKDVKGQVLIGTGMNVLGVREPANVMYATVTADGINHCCN